MRIHVLHIFSLEQCAIFCTYTFFIFLSLILILNITLREYASCTYSHWNSVQYFTHKHVFHSFFLSLILILNITLREYMSCTYSHWNSVQYFTHKHGFHSLLSLILILNITIPKNTSCTYSHWNSVRYSKHKINELDAFLSQFVVMICSLRSHKYIVWPSLSILLGVKDSHPLNTTETGDKHRLHGPLSS